MRTTLLAGLLALAVAAPAAAQERPAGENDFGGFRAVLPGGQGETVDAGELARFQATGERPNSFVDQLPLYRDLIPAAPGLAPDDLDRFFKSEGFGVPAEDVVTRTSPKPGVVVVRDRWNVPHVSGETRADVIWGAGYVSAQDRLFVMDVLRHLGRGRVSEFAGPGEDDENVRMDIAQLRAADYTEEELERIFESGIARAGAEGPVIRQDVESYVAGVNAYIAEARSDPDKLPVEYPALGESPDDWKITDTVAIGTLIGGRFGKGGGQEALAAQVLLAAQQRFGHTTRRKLRKARDVFADFRRLDDAEAPVQTRRRFPFPDPGRANRRAVALPDLGSIAEPTVEGLRTGESSSRGAGPLRGLDRLVGPGASNALMVTGAESQSGRPVVVFGPQVGYFSPQILMEMDLHGGGIDVRGATFPGISMYVLLGRGPDFAWSATSAATDVVDEFVERLCEPDGSTPTLESTHYVRNDRCVPLERREHTIRIEPKPSDFTSVPPEPTESRTVKVVLERSVHGPIQARATVRGQPVAIAEARSSYFHDVDSVLFFKRLNDGTVRDTQSFFDAARAMNLTFNWHYVDDRDVAFVQTGDYPVRSRGTDPSLPAWGTGRWDWQRFDAEAYTSRRVAFKNLPKDVNSSRGWMVSWNNKQAPGWRSADDLWAWGSVHRSQRLDKRIARVIAGDGKATLTEAVKVMADAATVDLRGQELYPWIRRVIGSTPPDEARPLLEALDRWAAEGAHRRDLDGDNVYEHSAAVALMDEWWPLMLRRLFTPTLGTPLFERIRDIQPLHDAPGPGGSAFFDGWYSYVDKDLRALLGKRVRDRTSRSYCGGGWRWPSRAELRRRSRRAQDSRDDDARRRLRPGRALPSIQLCRDRLLGSLLDAAADLRAALGPDLSSWKVPATCSKPPSGESEASAAQARDRSPGAAGSPPVRKATHNVPGQRDVCDQIEFTRLGAMSTPPIPWQDRPTWQQIVEVEGHRPR